MLYYEDGLLVRAVTRGNGYVGNDVTSNVRTIREVPLRLKRAVTVAVRGEIFLTREDFRQLNSTMEIEYANPRNLTAGTIRRIRSSEVARLPCVSSSMRGSSLTDRCSRRPMRNFLMI